MKNRKGFTLIELLAVIIILGVIMLIAIPSVTRYISDSRKSSYIDTAKQIVSGAIPMVNGGELDVYDTNTTYYIPAKCIPTENAMSSPYGEFVSAYVIVVYNGDGYEYYWASVDSAHQGIEMKEYNKLTKSDVKPNIDNIDTTLGIGSRTYIKILDEDECQTFVEGPSASNNIVVYPSGKTKETVTTGDLVTIGTEEFYVVKHNGDDLVLLSHYNLKVGSIYNESEEKVRDYSSSEDGYGRQSSEVKGRVDGLPTWNGVIDYSGSYYWEGKVGTIYQGNACTTSSGTNCAYLYDSNSKLYQYINSYKTYLEGQGATIKDARLMSLEESTAFRSANENAWKETSYWLGSVCDRAFVWTVGSYGGFLGTSYVYGSVFGVRPVIVI